MTAIISYGPRSSIFHHVRSQFVPFGISIYWVDLFCKIHTKRACFTTSAVNRLLRHFSCDVAMVCLFLDWLICLWRLGFASLCPLLWTSSLNCLKSTNWLDTNHFLHLTFQTNILIYYIKVLGSLRESSLFM